MHAQFRQPKTLNPCIPPKAKALICIPPNCQGAKSPKTLSVILNPKPQTLKCQLLSNLHKFTRTSLAVSLIPVVEIAHQ